MQYRPLGRSGLMVSVLTMGTMTFGGKGPFAKVGSTGVAEASRMFDACIDAGVNLFDTADIYSNGESEKIVGEALKGKRNDVLIATKARFRMGPGQNDAGLSRKHLMAACEASLTRLGTDVIDLYLLHEWDGITPVEEFMEALDRLMAHGKVRYVGCSNFSGWHIMKSLMAAEKHGSARFVSQQIHYTLQAREAEQELIPISLDQGLGIMVWSPLAGGLLSGRYTRDQQPEDGRLAAGWTEPPIHDQERLWKIVDALLAVAGAQNRSAAEIALAWLLTRPAVTTLVIGARTDAQLKSNLACVDIVLTKEQLDLLESASRTPLAYPSWHQKQTANDRLGPIDLTLIGPHL